MGSKAHTPEELFALRDAELQQARAILELAQGEEREFTEEETEAMERHQVAAQDFDRRGKIALRAREVDEGLEELEAVAASVPSRPVSRVKVRESIQDDPKLGYRHLGEFALSVFNNQNNPSADKRLSLVAAASGMSQAVGADGGFMVPPEFSRQIWDGLNDGTEALLGRTSSFSIEGESLTIPANAETSRANGSRYGGVRGYWKAEADQMTASQPKLRQLKLEPHEMFVFTYVTDKLLRNASALESYISMAAADEINFIVGDAIVNGDGVGKPLGLMNAPAKVEVAKEGSQAAATVLSQNLSKMWARLHPRSRASAVWLINPDIEPELDNLFTAVTNVAGSENVGGLNPRVYNPDARTIKGRPIIPVEYAQTLGTAGDIILTDLSAYATATRGGVRGASSMHLRFDYNETAFRWIFEVDGQPYINSAITPFKGSNTLSTIVTLAERS